jgi:hypothetical protein
MASSSTSSDDGPQGRGGDANVKGVEFLFKKNKIDLAEGHGRSPAPARSSSGRTARRRPRDQEHRHRHRLGSAPLPGVEVDEKRSSPRPARWSWRRFPSHLVVIGAGVIGLELGSVWRRLGAKVTVVEFSTASCPAWTARSPSSSSASWTKQGMKFKLKHQGHRRHQGRRGRDPDGRARRWRRSREAFEADIVLLAIGRRPYTDGLGLEAGVELDERGRVKIDGHFDQRARHLRHRRRHRRRRCWPTRPRMRAWRWPRSRRPGRPCELRRHPGIVYTSRGRLRRQDRGELKAAGRRLQGRQVPLHGQWPGARHGDIPTAS